MRKIVLIFIGLVLGLSTGFVVHAYLQPGTLDRATQQFIATTVLGAPLDREVIGVHHSYMSRLEYFEEAYEQAKTMRFVFPENGVRNTRAMVVPHHLLAKHYIAQAFSGVADNRVKTVVVISPNHFSLGDGQVITSEYVWETPYGPLYPDRELAGKLVQSKSVTLDESVFADEHGVSAIMPFVKKSFPYARVVPLVVKESFAKQDAKTFAKLLARHVDKDTMVIGSFDFSHYLPDAPADFHDEKSLALLHTLNTQTIEHLDVDSKAGLTILLEYLTHIDAPMFQQVGHSSAAKLTENPDLSENTSHITGYWMKGEPTSNDVVTMHVFGDIMLDRFVRTTLDKRGTQYPFTHITRFMDGADMVVANLEGPVTHHTSVATDPDIVTFTFDPDHVAALRDNHITHVSLANNHSLNFGHEGLATTHDELDALGLQYFGDPQNAQQLSVVQEVRGMKIALIGHTQFFGNPHEPIIAEITRLRSEVDVIIVYAHWGNEYQTTRFSTRQQDAAHAFIDAGADVVIGAHPHVVQPFELYQGKMIFYSLGNFIFDQLFSDDVRTELSLGLVIRPDEIEAYLFPMENDNLQIKLMEPQKRDILLTTLAKHSTVPEELREQIFYGHIVLPRE